jgi:hypothetical protein
MEILPSLKPNNFGFEEAFCRLETFLGPSAFIGVEEQKKQLLE